MSKNTNSTISRIQIKRTTDSNKLSGSTALYVGEPLLAKTSENTLLAVGRPEGDNETTDDQVTPASDWCWFLGKSSKSDLLTQAARLNTIAPAGTNPSYTYMTTEADTTNWVSPRLNTTEISAWTTGSGSETTTYKFPVTFISEAVSGEEGRIGKLYTTSTIYAENGILFGAGWNPDTTNDYAESRLVQTEAEAGQCVVEVGNGTMVVSTDYLQPTGSIVSDTYGHRIGPKTADYKAIAISGRVLVYVDESKGKLEVGDCVMTAPNGKVAKMTRRQVKKYPDRIVGIVSEFPGYDTWGKIEVKGRVWIRVK